MPIPVKPKAVYTTTDEIAVAKILGSWPIEDIRQLIRECLRMLERAELDDRACTTFKRFVTGFTELCELPSFIITVLIGFPQWMPLFTDGIAMSGSYLVALLDLPQKCEQ
jgi:hypothetical protein